jgi:hypothetical protein
MVLNIANFPISPIGYSGVRLVCRYEKVDSCGLSTGLLRTVCSCVAGDLCHPLNCKKKELCLLEDAFTAVCVSKKELHKNG